MFVSTHPANLGLGDFLAKMPHVLSRLSVGGKQATEATSLSYMKLARKTMYAMRYKK
jgi:hypothetical protein